MSLHLDLEYLHLLSPQLDNFKRKRDGEYNCRCFICGDSQKSKFKARGYFFKHENSLLYKCFNCSVSLAFRSVLKQLDTDLYNEYCFHSFRTGKPEAQKKEIFTPVVKKIQNIGLESFSNLPDNHYAKQYVINRAIPESQYSRIYFTADWGKWASETVDKKYEKPNDHRIVLPFFDQEGNLTGAQGRSLSGSKKDRYMTARVNEEESMVFGLDKWDKFKQTLVVEGPIDSLFLPNCLAVASSDLFSIFSRVNLDKENTILIFDNEPKNPEICSLMGNAIENDTKVCIWPEDLRSKDINDMILKENLTATNVFDMVKAHIYSGLNAKLRFAKWKKC